VFHFFIDTVWIKQAWSLEKFLYLNELKYRNDNFFYATQFYFFIIDNSQKILYWFFITVCLFLAIIGGKPIEYPYLFLGRLFTFFYFLYFFILIYSNTIYTKFKDVFNYNLSIIEKKIVDKKLPDKLFIHFELGDIPLFSEDLVDSNNKNS
jgi:hypothetical protein